MIDRMNRVAKVIMSLPLFSTLSDLLVKEGRTRIVEAMSEGKSSLVGLLIGSIWIIDHELSDIFPSLKPLLHFSCDYLLLILSAYLIMSTKDVTGRK
jgi:hypothetical protein